MANKLALFQRGQAIVQIKQAVEAIKRRMVDDRNIWAIRSETVPGVVREAGVDWPPLGYGPRVICAICADMDLDPHPEEDDFWDGDEEEEEDVTGGYVYWTGVRRGRVTR